MSEIDEILEDLKERPVIIRVVIQPDRVTAHTIGFTAREKPELVTSTFLPENQFTLSGMVDMVWIAAIAHDGVSLLPEIPLNLTPTSDNPAYAMIHDIPSDCLRTVRKIYGDKTLDRALQVVPIWEGKELYLEPGVC